MDSAQIRPRGILPNVHSASKKRMERLEVARKCGDILLSQSHKARADECPDPGVELKKSSVQKAQSISLFEFEEGKKLTLIPGEFFALSDQINKFDADICLSGTLCFRLCSDIESAGDFPSFSTYDDPMIKYNVNGDDFGPFDIACICRICRLTENIIQVLIGSLCVRRAV